MSDHRIPDGKCRKFYTGSGHRRRRAAKRLRMRFRQLRRIGLRNRRLKLRMRFRRLRQWKRMRMLRKLQRRMLRERTRMPKL